MDHIISSEEWISYDMVFGEKCVHQTCIHINKEISFLFFLLHTKKKCGQAGHMPCCYQCHDIFMLNLRPLSFVSPKHLSLYFSPFLGNLDSTLFQGVITLCLS